MQQGQDLSLRAMILTTWPMAVRDGPGFRFEPAWRDGYCDASVTSVEPSVLRRPEARRLIVGAGRPPTPARPPRAQTVVIRMTLLTTERLVGQCGNHTAKLESAPGGRLPITKCFGGMWAVGRSDGGGGGGGVARAYATAGMCARRAAGGRRQA